MTKTIKVKDFREMLDILDTQNVSRNPIYTGFGLEVYENHEKQIQIVYNCRDGKNEVTVNKGY